MKLRKISLAMPKGYSKWIHASVILLTLFGLFMIISATATKDATSSTALLVVIAKELFFITVSYYMMVLLARSYKQKTFEKYYWLFLLVLFILLISTMAFAPAPGSDTRAWIRFFGITIQPSEFAKIGVILIMARTTGGIKNKNKTASDILTHPIIVVSIIVGIVVLAQKDFGSGLIILGIAVFCSLVSSHGSLYKTQIVLFALALLVLILMFLSVTELGMEVMKFVHISDYMINRFKTSFDPFADRYGPGMQIFNGLAAFVQGGWFGVGYGKGFLKYSYIFAVETDSILASVVEELGVIFGFLPIFIGYVVIVFELMKNALFIKNEKDRIILVGTIAYIFFHFFLNVGGVTALIPLTGVPLLFISAGGSSRLAIMMAIGLCQNVIARNAESTKIQNSKS